MVCCCSSRQQRRATSTLTPDASGNAELALQSWQLPEAAASTRNSGNGRLGRYSRASLTPAVQTDNTVRGADCPGGVLSD